LKNQLRALLRVARRLVNRPDYAHKYCFAWHLERVLKHYQVDCVFDVGAHFGEYHDFLRYEVGFRGLIQSFEPVSEHVERLRQRARRDPRWRVAAEALGAEAGGREINVMKSGLFSSFRQPDVSEVADYSAKNVIDHQEKVQVNTLDSVFDQLKARDGFQRPYLKVDTQGFDLEVLRGSSQCLKSFVGLQFEASVRHLYRNSPGHMEVLHYVADAGFELTGMYPVSYDRALRLVEYDCVMLNRRFAEGQG
jgi:FkbM family methyltransferase